jgi:hypothetical protein
MGADVLMGRFARSSFERSRKVELASQLAVALLAERNLPHF